MSLNHQKVRKMETEQQSKSPIGRGRNQPMNKLPSNHATAASFKNDTLKPESNPSQALTKNFVAPKVYGAKQPQHHAAKSYNTI